ncbi:MAG: hypothetical protein V7701_10260, partial [Sneathiella sp.]
VPVGDKLEIRIKGANVHTGYYKRPDLTAKYFDEDGFYCIGDAVKWEDPSKKQTGLVFNGRVAEDFKLANGTWVSTGSLRLSLIDALDPIVRDIVIAGHDKDDVGLLILPTESVLRQVEGNPDAVSVDGEAIVDSDFLQQVKMKLEKYNEDNRAPSRRAGRAVVMATPLSIDKNEITDKQYINQSAVLSNRADLVRQLYANSANKSVLKF